MIFKTKEDLKKRLTYIWDFADKNSDIDFMLNELWKDIEETKVKNLAQPDVSGQLPPTADEIERLIESAYGEPTGKGFYIPKLERRRLAVMIEMCNNVGCWR